MTIKPGDLCEFVPFDGMKVDESAQGLFGEFCVVIARVKDPKAYVDWEVEFDCDPPNYLRKCSEKHLKKIDGDFYWDEIKKLSEVECE